jgi:hypothetical protein
LGTASEVNDLAAADGALFELQTWVDAGDVAFPDLLAARLNAELALRETPWEEVRGTPRAQERLADTWPLSSTLSAMRWRPGDGVRLDLPDVSVVDDTPRQLTQVTRTFAAEGRTGTQVAWRQRPRSAGRSVRSLLRAALGNQRSYQGQKVALTGDYVTASAVAAGGFTGYSRIALFPGDVIVGAELRIVYNSASQPLDAEVNNTLRGGVLGGPWTTTPVAIYATAYATQVSTTLNELYVRLKNTGGSATDVEFQLIVEVLR